MINETALKDVLVSAIEKLKANQEQFSLLSNEVAAMRETLKELLGDRFSEIFQKWQIELMAKTVQLESAAKQLNTVLIEAARNVVAP